MSLLDTIPLGFQQLFDRPVAIFGVGASGQAIADLLEASGIEYVSYDERRGKDESVRHAFTSKTAKKHGLVIHSPAFRLDHPWITAAEKAGCPVVSEIDFAQQMRTGPTIIVTGTNGKTTLQEFITFSLKRSGISAVAAGQNAYPLSRLAVHPELDGVTAVLEMSPAYAKRLKKFRFNALFWTNFHEEHIEDLDERRKVFNDLLHLVSLSPDAALYFGDSVFTAAGELGCELPERARALEEKDYPDWELPDWSAFATNIHRPALALFRRYWHDRNFSDSLLKSSAENFEVRAHRLHVLTKVGKSAFWNDSKAGNFAATLAALDNFHEPVIWIGGGHYRGGNLEAFVEQLRPSLKGAVVIGDAREKLVPVLRQTGIPVREAGDLRTAVEIAARLAEGEAPVVFSPGFIAGETYGDFMERGMCYENAVLGLKHQSGAV